MHEESRRQLHAYQLTASKEWSSATTRMNVCRLIRSPIVGQFASRSSSLLLELGLDLLSRPFESVLLDFSI